MTAEARSAPSPEGSADLAVEAARYKKKQILVAVLLIGLLIAIVTQPTKEDPAGTQAGNINQQAEAMITTSPPSQRTPDSAETRQQDLTQIRELSRMELSDIVKLELFTAATLPVPRVPTKAIERPERTQRVRAIYGSSTGRAALLGDSIVRGGQPLPDGSRVTDVTTDGIQVEP